MKVPEKTTARQFRDYVRGELIAVGTGPAWTDVLVAIYRRNRVEKPFVVPAVAEPLVVCVLSGTAEIQEREFDGPWTEHVVRAGDFFLTTSPTPYELRWQVVGEEPFETCHVYMSLPVFARAIQEAAGIQTEVPNLREVSGERDPDLSALIELLRIELLSEPRPSPLYISGLAQSLAVYLVRHYPAPNDATRPSRGGLPAFKLHRIVGLLEGQIDQEFQLARFAEDAEMSEFHFSRAFKKTTGLSPSQYMIRLRMDKARQLLRETQKSAMEVALDVGYSSPSHFAQIFRREVGVTPSQYRGKE